MSFTADDREFLYNLLVKRFSLDELETLVWLKWGLKPGTFPRETHPKFCLALLVEREERGQISSLVQAILAQRDETSLPRAEHQTLVALLARLEREEATQATRAEPKARQAQEAQRAPPREETRASQAVEPPRWAETQRPAEARASEEVTHPQKVIKGFEELRAIPGATVPLSSDPEPGEAASSRFTFPSLDSLRALIPTRSGGYVVRRRGHLPIAVHRLSVWKPLDHFRLLWWLFMAPGRLVAHRERFGEEAEKRVGAWLVSTLSWLPLFILALALGLEQLPRTENALASSTYLWVSAGLCLAWLLTSVLDIIGDDTDRDAVGIAVGTAVFVAVFVAVGVAVFVAGFVAFFVAVFGALGVAGGVALVGALGVALGVAFVGALGVRGGVGGGVALVVALVVTLVVALGSALGSALGVVLGVASLVTLGVEDAMEKGQATPLTRSLFFLLFATYGFLVWFSFFGGWRLFGAG